MAGVFHGGGIAAAAARYGGRAEDWLDLSTGINPEMVALPDIPERVWNRLPDRELELSARAAARDWYLGPGNTDDSLLPLPVCQDYKAAYDGDEGPNTGGMGAYSPLPQVDADLSTRVMDEIMRPIVQAMAAEGRPYQGVLYAGLMLVNRRPYVLEFNARFGDPEAQILMMRLNSDLLPLLQATTNGALAQQLIDGIATGARG